MVENTAFLSPNGQSVTRGTGPANRAMVATIAGVATLSRKEPGDAWRVAGMALEDRHIGALVFEPGSGKLFAGAHHDGGLWVSDDGTGTRWRRLTRGLDRQHVYALACRRVAGRTTLFLGTSPAALYRSDDLGESWTEIKTIRDVPDTDKWTFPPPPHIAHVKNIVFHPAEPKTLYVLVEQGAFLKSVDDGRTWTDLTGYSDPKDIAYRDVHRLLIDPANPDTLYLATGEGLYRSDDGGARWVHLMRRGDRMGYPDFLFFDPLDSRIVYMGGSYLNPAQWYRAGKADSTVLRSEDRGHTWVELNRGLPQPVIGAFEAMSQHVWDGGMMLLLGTATGEVFASEDGGAHWALIARVPAVSKDDHHLPFLSAEERARAMAVRGL